jgi:pimeloyl-ACP methyl ester carboxylesterase
MKRTLVSGLMAALTLAVTPVFGNTAAPSIRRDAYTFVIVPGAWGGGWDWKTVDRLLSKDGHTVYRITLTGLGERVHLASPAITLTTHISDVVNVILYEDLHDIVLVGHSYAGMVLTGVMDRVPDRIRCVIFLDAALPQDGESCYDVYGARVRAYKVEDGFIIPSWLDRTRPPPFYVPQPVKTWSDPVSYTNPAAKELPAAYVLFAPKGQAPETTEGFKLLQRAKDRGWPTYVMESDHMAHQSHPIELTSLLERLAQDKRKPPPQVPLPTLASGTPVAGAPGAPRFHATSP